MTSKMTELKCYLKKMAQNIKQYKQEIKDYQRKHGGSCDGKQWILIKMKSDYRNHHIAYSMLRGQDYEDIEPSRNIDSSPNWSAINRIKEQHAEAVCADAA